MDGPWNKINIPFPSAVSVYRIPYSEATDTVVQYVVAKSEKFLQMFCSEVLQTEIRVLYDVLYVINNSFRRHKPFRALKQVEQCINRVKEMKLQEAVQDLWVACPKKAQRTMGLECGECEVPSQAILEWTCVKMVGGAHLLTCLLDHCSRAFILIRRHLQTGDFLILNLLLISMLSRLWVLFRGLLRALLPLYQCCLELLEPVSSARPLPYLSGCTLPAELAATLGPSGTALLDVVDPTGRARRTGRRGARPTLLSRLFGQEGQDPGAAEGGRTRTASGTGVGAQKASRLIEDLGSIVRQRSLDIISVGAELDMKALLMGTRAANTQMATLPNQRRSSCQDPAVISQKKKFVKLLDSATSFSDLAVTLQEVIQWCRDRKLSQERRSLAFMCVKCRRMVSMEADGQSVTRRLQLFQRTLRWGLLHGRWRSPRRRHSLRTLWRQCLGCRASFRTLRNHYGTLTQKNRTFQAGSRTVRAVSSKHEVLPRQPVDFSGEEVGGSDVISAAVVAAGSGGKGKSAKTVPREPADANEDDIDDIFASIGF
ncbi:nucleolus and neural progenitor protein [Alosa sapidissima]|uniref:nucleolus and neural progenitor protein n=1 Tax=Alosa sapidissima TaxID=34773 RepID=UPI001C080359|nr:nucleolus and neural progenitor protein [Alosa sapidissima]